MSKTFQITFNPDGTTEIKTSEFRGNSCMTAAQFLKKALGSVLNTKKTPEIASLLCELCGKRAT